jgi:hypothetical protein
MDRPFVAMCVRYAGQLFADTVAKVENRSAPKISRKFTLGCLSGCITFQRHWEGPWSILDETIWGPPRRRAQNASAALRIFVRHPKKTFATISAHLGYRAHSASSPAYFAASRVFSTSPNMMPLSVAQLPFPLGPASIDDHHLEHGGGPYRYPGNMTLR